MDDDSLAALARLHLDCLPHSVIGAMGRGYVHAFYRYVDRSSRELLVVERDARGQPIAAAVLSLEPATLNRRLLVRTPLAVSLAKRFPALLALAAAALRARRDRASATPIPERDPQVILIFTAEAERGRGRASSLLAAIERELRQRGIERYEVRTEADPSNPALRFYAARGFEDRGISLRFGTAFTVFSRTLPAAAR